jgi:rhodanese-related sulfurtransferase/DNA-binding transcriptional ArsR family regulator
VDPSLRNAALGHYEELARLGRAIASPARLRMIDLLRQGPRSVEALAEQAGLEMANASHHLQQMRAARLVVSEKEGQRVVYRLASNDVGHLFVSLRLLAESVLPEFDRIKAALHVNDDDKRGELLQRIARGEVTVLDVRPKEEWQSGHLLDAMHIPLPELQARVQELPKKRPVVAYCRGPFCPMALTAVDLLRDAGFEAEHLDLGPADVAAGTGFARRLVVVPVVPRLSASKLRSARGPGPADPTTRATSRTRKKKLARRDP